MRRGRSRRRLARGAAVFTAVAAAASCGGNATYYVTVPLPDGGADGASGIGTIGTAVVENGGEPTDFKYSYAILVNMPNRVVLMLFLTNRPRTCAEHLAGIDYIGQQDIYYPVAFPLGAEPAGGTWHFTSALDGAPLPPSTPNVMAWFLAHEKCGSSGRIYGSPSFPNNVNYLTLTEVSASRVSGDFILQLDLRSPSRDGPGILYLHGSFDSVPCVATYPDAPDPVQTWATLPSKTCR